MTSIPEIPRVEWFVDPPLSARLGDIFVCGPKACDVYIETNIGPDDYEKHGIKKTRILSDCTYECVTSNKISERVVMVDGQAYPVYAERWSLTRDFSGDNAQVEPTHEPTKAEDC